MIFEFVLQVTIQSKEKYFNDIVLKTTKATGETKTKPIQLDSIEKIKALAFFLEYGEPTDNG